MKIQSARTSPYPAFSSSAPNDRGPSPARWRLPNVAAVTGGYVVAYVLLDFASYLHPVAPYAITPWNPPPGLSLALLLAYGLRYAPALFVASILAELLVRGIGAPAVEIVAYATILALGYTATAVLLKRLRFDPRFSSVRDLLVFAVTVAGSALVVSTLYISAHVVAGRFAWSDFADYALQFWVGDVIGIIVTTPFLLVHGRRLVTGRWRLSGEMILQALAIAAVLAIIFSMDDAAAAKFFYLLFLPLIWICVRHGFRGATAGLLATQLGLITAVHVAGYATQSVLEFQLLMLALSITGALLGMTVSEWRHASQALEAREAELHRAMRVAAAAEMASAIAHELNQPIMAASNYVQASEIMLAREPQAPAELSGTLHKAHTEMGRAAEVVKRLRDFYRGGVARRDRLSVAELLDYSLQPLRGRLATHQVRIVERLSPDLPQLAVDRVQLAMVLHNLLANAIDSIASTEGAVRDIVVEGTDEGASVKLAVHDSGPGIAPSIAGQLFQRFATSKPTGMGLGLNISRSIVERHGGRLWLESSERGARFALTLPPAKRA